MRHKGKKGWQAAYRDALMLKMAYSEGLRFNELRHLQTVDIAINPHVRQFGKFGICKVVSQRGCLLSANEICRSDRSDFSDGRP